MPLNQQFVSKVPPEMDGQRLDQVVLACIQYSVASSKMDRGHVRVDDKIIKPKERLTGGEEIIINAIQEPQIRT